MSISVCYVLAEYPVLSQTFVHAEMVALRAAGVHVGVVAHQSGDSDLRFGDGPDGEPFQVLHVGLQSSAQLDRVLRQFSHLHGHFADFGIRILQPIADRVDLPFSFMAHAYDLFRQDAAVTPDEWATLSDRCVKVATISRFHRDFIADRGIDRDRIALVPNAARLSALMARAPEAPKELRRILAVGRPTPKKGFQELIDAWQQARVSVPHLELELIGCPPLGVEVPGLTVHGLRPYQEVLDAMAKADLVVASCIQAPSGDMDGIPTVLAEAGALRRPVVASRLSGIPDLVVSGVNGLLVPPGCANSLAMALVRLAGRPAELTRMGLAAPRLAACHEASVTARRLMEIFHPTESPARRILVADSFSSSNRGDAAILDGILSGLRARLPEAEITVLSHYPGVARSFHEGVTLVGDDDPVVLATLLTETDFVVSCGGSFINDIYGLNLGPRLALYHAAHRAEIPVVFFAQSMGPLQEPQSRVAAREVLSGSAWVLARDPATAKVLQELGVSCPVDVGVDAAVGGGWDPHVYEQGPVLGVTCRDWYFPGVDDRAAAQQAYEDEMVRAISAWQQASGGRVVFLSNCTDLGGYRHDDRVCARRIAGRLKGEVDVDEVQDRRFSDVRGRAAACDFFLGTRMHSLIFATMGGVPAFGVAYEFKTPEWLTRVGLDGLCVDIQDCSGLAEGLLEAWHARADHKASVAASLPGIRAAADAQLDELVAIIEGKRLQRDQTAARKLPGWQGETFKYDLAHRRMKAVVDIVLGESGPSVLDIGCSTGQLGRMLGPLFDYTGVDVAAAVATEQEGFRIRTADLNTAPIPTDDVFDTVVCSGSLEYLDDIPSVLSALRERVRPGGLGVFTLYNLSHFSRVVQRASRHPTWRFDERPDELMLALAEAGFAPQRILATSVGYGPSRAVNDERPTDHDRQGAGQIAGVQLMRRAHQVVVVCRAAEPVGGPGAIQAHLQQEQKMEALRIAVDLVKRYPWSRRAWNDLGVLFHMHGDATRAKEALGRAVRCDPAYGEARENFVALGGSLDALLAGETDPELKVMLEPGSEGAWTDLIQHALSRGHLVSASLLLGFRDRCLERRVG
jgi:polysaccharide pyruvyl transferase WcaK-like protein/glycosyltransferase involved in cell wall biosynthesis/SAM-dependent methyltransferase